MRLKRSERGGTFPVILCPRLNVSKDVVLPRLAKVDPADHGRRISYRVHKVFLTWCCRLGSWFSFPRGCEEIRMGVGFVGTPAEGSMCISPAQVSLCVVSSKKGGGLMNLVSRGLLSAC